MSLKTLVKVSTITNLSDARYCAGMGVAMAGFDVNPGSENYVDPVRFQAITEWIAGVQLVGELATAEAIQVNTLLSTYALDYLQADYSTDWDALRKLGIPLICRVKWHVRMNEATFFQDYEPLRGIVEWFLLESDDDTFAPGDVAALQVIASRFPVLLGFGISAKNVLTLLNEVPIGGIALKGSEEIRPGFKDFDDLAEILEVLEEQE